jgi:hypothetical protein
MNKRDSVRYDSDLLPETLDKVIISWEGSPPVESNVLNCCSRGMKIIISTTSSLTNFPNKKDILKVHIPKIKMSLTGMCVSVTKEADNSISMGIYLINPSEQNVFKDYLHESLKHILPQDFFISYEWEELVDKLCLSDDPKLKHIGITEFNNIKTKTCKVISS